MSKSRMTLIAAVAAFAVMLVGGVGTAAAQTPPDASQVVAITGKAKNGKSFKGTYTIQRFVSRSGKVYSVGTVKGRFKGRRVTKRGVMAPATLSSLAAAQGSQLPAPAIPPTPNACEILRLELGPIDLNLLGLRVRTDEINVLIEGVRGPGNLLGNLLCGITGILDPQP